MLVRNAKTAGVDYNLRKLTDLNYKAKKLEYKYNGPKKRN